MLEAKENCAIILKEHKPSPKKEFEHQYSAAKCLKCGLCPEICPMKIPTLSSMAKLNRRR